jgi:hypothetical protein
MFIGILIIPPQPRRLEGTQNSMVMLYAVGNIHRTFDDAGNSMLWYSWHAFIEWRTVWLGPERLESPVANGNAGHSRPPWYVPSHRDG